MDCASRAEVPHIPPMPSEHCPTLNGSIFRTSYVMTSYVPLEVLHDTNRTTNAYHGLRPAIGDNKHITHLALSARSLGGVEGVQSNIQSIATQIPVQCPCSTSIYLRHQPHTACATKSCLLCSLEHQSLCSIGPLLCTPRLATEHDTGIGGIHAERSEYIR